MAEVVRASWNEVRDLTGQLLVLVGGSSVRRGCRILLGLRDRKAAKELLHIQSWLIRVDEIVRRGKEA
jgi:hypothetical protein